MASLPNSPTKQQEIDHIRAFAAALPTSSYLRDIFTQETLNDIEVSIRNDFGHTLDPTDCKRLVTEQRRELAEKRREVQEAIEERNAAQMEQKKAEREFRYIVESMKEAMESANTAYRSAQQFIRKAENNG